MIKISELREKLVRDDCFRDFEFLFDKEELEDIEKSVEKLVDAHYSGSDENIKHQIHMICLNLALDYIEKSDIEFENGADDKISLLDAIVFSVIELLTVDKFSRE